MNLDQFAAQIRDMMRRTTSLREKALSQDDSSRLLFEALEELQTSLEELTVAEEELRDQNAQLVTINAELELERRRYRSLFLGAPVAYVVTDAGITIREMNRVATTMLGGQKQQVGVPLAMFVSAAERDRFRKLVDRTRTFTEDPRPELLHIRCAGFDTWCHTRVFASAERSADGEVVAFRFMIVDLDLEERARRADALAQEARHKDEFLAMLAHELRNPLAPIRAAVELWRHHADALTPEQRQWSVEVVARQTDHVAHLVDDLLDVSRVSHGKIRLQRGRFDLREAVEQAREAMRAAAIGHELVCELPTEAVFVEGDAPRMRQVVVNLVDNAIKFTPKGRRIVLRLRPEGEEAVLETCDEGVGLRTDQLESIFTLFGQADRTLGRTSGGLGLGLALVRKLVELHKGTVVATSGGLGHGATFTVRLPRVDAPPVLPAPSESQAGIQLRRRILVVDDNRDAAEMLSTLLSAEGHETDICLDGNGALEAFTSFAPDAVLLDLGLPDVDGLEVARHLRARSGSVLLVAVTGYGDEAMRARTRESGFDHHLLKPVDLDGLRALLLTRRKPNVG